MNRIRTLQDLEYQKVLLRLQRVQAEQSIRKDWETLKKEGVGQKGQVDPANAEQVPPTQKVLHSLVEAGAGWFGKKLASVASRQIEIAVHRGIDRLLRGRRRDQKK